MALTVSDLMERQAGLLGGVLVKSDRRNYNRVIMPGDKLSLVVFKVWLDIHPHSSQPRNTT